MNKKPRTFAEQRAMRKQRRGEGFESGSGCYTCVICGKKTRDTNYGSEAQAKICRACYQDLERENAQS